MHLYGGRLLGDGIVVEHHGIRAGRAIAVHRHGLHSGAHIGGQGVAVDVDGIHLVSLILDTGLGGIAQGRAVHRLVDHLHVNPGRLGLDLLGYVRLGGHIQVINRHRVARAVISGDLHGQNGTVDGGARVEHTHQHIAGGRGIGVQPVGIRHRQGHALGQGLRRDAHPVGLILAPADRGCRGGYGVPRTIRPAQDDGQLLPVLRLSRQGEARQQHHERQHQCQDALPALFAQICHG